jgi:hypothetical protein
MKTYRLTNMTSPYDTVGSAHCFWNYHKGMIFRYASYLDTKLYRLPCIQAETHADYRCSNHGSLYHSSSKKMNIITSVVYTETVQQIQNNICIYCSMVSKEVNSPHEKAKSTSKNRKKNLTMSTTILLKDTCIGPRYGLTEKMYIIRRQL